MHDEILPSHEPRPDPLPDTLRNWQVLEIDSQATPVPAATIEAATVEAAAPAADRQKEGGDLQSSDLQSSDLQISDRQDAVIVAALANRCRQAECGATVEYAIQVLNNGPHAAAFYVQVEGWIDPQWVGDTALSVTAEPGSRTTLSLPLLAPRTAESEAGDYHFAIVVRSPQYPDRFTRLGALLTVLPFDAVEARFLDLPDTSVAWLRRSATLPLSVTNRGNHPAQVSLHGANGGYEHRFTFGVQSDLAGAGSLPLQRNQAITLPVRVEVRRPPLVGINPRMLPVHVDVQVNGQPAGTASTQVKARPLMGPWQIVGAGALGVAGAVGLLLVMALVYLLAQRDAIQQVPAAAVAAPPAAAAPPVIIVTLNQPADTVSSAGPPAGSSAAVSDFTAGPAPDPALPLVLPDQVSAPGGAVAGGAPAVAYAGAAAPSDMGTRPVAPGSSTSQTYSQMFQTVGSEFDLDWRMLAAQAYIESGFDSLALSDSGAMGLMQILPDTWREWAPAVEVSDPFDAYSSVLVAAVYLDYLRQGLAAQGYPDAEWMLVAYNWGPDRLNEFLAGGGTWETLPEMRRQYASEILRIAKSIP